MSLMLDALKRIEAKQASARAAASRAAGSSEPPLAAATAEAIEETDPFLVSVKMGLSPSPPAIEENWPDFSVDDKESVPLEASIESPPELSSDGIAGPAPDVVAPEDTALPDAVWMETAMGELSDLLAEARLLDQPVELESPVASAWIEEEADVGNQDFSRSRETPSHYDYVSDALADAPIPQNEPEGACSSSLSWTPELPIEVAKPASEEAAVMPPARVEPDFEATAERNPDPSQVAEPGNASHAPAEVFADTPVIKPLGSDPYAAAAWQILRQLPQGRSQMLQFTSPGDGHGKTLTLARLLPHVARSFAGNVLVVDANTRNPDLARRLEVAVTWRLTDVLSGATHWMNAVRATSLPRVSLLPGGTGTLRRPDVRTAAGLLRELSAHYDLVLIDTTSLAHEGAAQLAATCDGTCLVVRLGEASRRSVRESVRVIDNAGGRLLGYIAVDAGA
jgi:Mrp family chromosome partitioning ATPase